MRRSFDTWRDWECPSCLANTRKGTRSTSSLGELANHVNTAPSQALISSVRGTKNILFNSVGLTKARSRSIPRVSCSVRAANKMFELINWILRLSLMKDFHRKVMLGFRFQYYSHVDQHISTYIAKHSLQTLEYQVASVGLFVCFNKCTQECIGFK